MFKLTYALFAIALVQGACATPVPITPDELAQFLGSGRAHLVEPFARDTQENAAEQYYPYYPAGTGYYRPTVLNPIGGAVNAVTTTANNLVGGALGLGAGIVNGVLGGILGAGQGLVNGAVGGATGRLL